MLTIKIIALPNIQLFGYDAFGFTLAIICCPNKLKHIIQEIMIKPNTYTKNKNIPTTQHCSTFPQVEDYCHRAAAYAPRAENYCPSTEDYRPRAEHDSHTAHEYSPRAEHNSHSAAAHCLRAADNCHSTAGYCHRTENYCHAVPHISPSAARSMTDK